LLARAQFVEHSLLSVADGLLVADVQGVIAFANPRAAEMLGVAQRALIGSNLFERLTIGHSDEREAPHRLLSKSRPLERELAMGAQHYTLRVAVVKAEGDAEALGFVATLSDITRQHELQQARNDVMALVTHELKTPLTAIQGMSGLLAQYEVDADKRREMHLAINDEAKRLARLIDQYLNVTRLESGSQPLRLASVQPAQLIERVLLLLEPIAAQRGIRLVRRLASDLPLQSLDADLIAQALTNLVSNAIKFSQADSEIIITTRIEADALHINITDQGCGIPAESLPHVFEKFYRVPDIEQADIHGAGLGLALVREIAERHSGRVTVTSEIGQGSVFTLILPLE
jgi:PAS domain S-box-containing protein